ncbi:MAG: Hpt domain-containing protein [Halioglobus sp.]
MSDALKQVVLDTQRLDQIRQLEKEGEPSILNQIVDAFLEVSPALLTALIAGVQASDAKAIEFNAHALKSGSANLGAGDFSKLCHRLELVGRSGALAGADKLMAELRDAFPLVCEALSLERSVT